MRTVITLLLVVGLLIGSGSLLSAFADDGSNTPADGVGCTLPGASAMRQPATRAGLHWSKGTPMRHLL